MADVRVEGDPAGQFRRLARDLRAAGAKDLQRELYSSLRVASRPLIDAAKESAAATLPKGGGSGKRKTRLVKTGTVTIEGKEFVKRTTKVLGTKAAPSSVADRVVGARYKVKVRSGRTAGIYLSATSAKGKSIDLASLDQGRLRHPLFGNRQHWYQQEVPAGWWTHPMEAGVPEVRAAIEGAVTRMVSKFNAT